jgi:hypothetical protein
MEMSVFIELTSPNDLPVYLQPDDVKAILAGPATCTEILLYGPQETWIAVKETPAEVAGTIAVALSPEPTTAAASFPGRN